MLPFTLRQLEIFLAAAEDSHFALTAERLGISQAAVSEQIKKLETQLDATLFIRRPGAKPMLSPFGATFLQQAERFVNEGKKTGAAAKNIPREERQLVRIFAGPLILDNYIRPNLERFHQDHGNIMIQILPFISSLPKMADQVRRRKADLLLYSMEDPKLAGLHTEVVVDDAFRLYGAQNFNRYRHASPLEISGLPFVGYLTGSSMDEWMQSLLSNAGIVTQNVVARTQYYDTALQLVHNGTGLAPLWKSTVEHHPDRDVFVEFDIDFPVMYRCIIRRDEPVSAAVHTVEDYSRRLISSFGHP